jgi:hypothetical protein
MLSCRYHKLSTSNGREGGHVPGRTGLRATTRSLPMPLATRLVSCAPSGYVSDIHSAHRGGTASKVSPIPL